MSIQWLSSFTCARTDGRTDRQRGRDTDNNNKCSTEARTRLELLHTFIMLQYLPWYTMAQLVDILCYKTEGRGFDRDFSLT